MLRRLQVQLWQLSKLMPTSLNKHLEACGVVPVYYASGWLMTAFSCDFPISFAARWVGRDPCVTLQKGETSTALDDQPWPCACSHIRYCCRHL